MGIDYLLHCVVDTMRNGEDEDPPIGEIMDYIKELQMCWKMLNEDFGARR